MEKVASVGAVGGAQHVKPDQAVTDHFQACVLKHPEDAEARRAAFSAGLAEATGLRPGGWMDECHRFC
eukprot:4467420-Alexandrium_andersonii.AAC.1